MFLTDSLPPELEERRRDLIERRARLRAALIGDADRETKEEIEEIERMLRAFDQQPRR